MSETKTIWDEMERFHGLHGGHVYSVGDEVVITTIPRSSETGAAMRRRAVVAILGWPVATVERITPTGQVAVSGGMRFKPETSWARDYKPRMLEIAAGRWDGRGRLHPADARYWRLIEMARAEKVALEAEAQRVELARALADRVVKLAAGPNADVMLGAVRALLDGGPVPPVVVPPPAGSWAAIRPLVQRYADAAAHVAALEEQEGTPRLDALAPGALARGIGDARRDLDDARRALVERISPALRTPHADFKGAR